MKGFLAALFAAAVVRLWLMPLGSSFWLDETVTAFVAARPGDPSLAVAPQVTASIYYWLPRLAVRTLGFSEAACRLPSVLAMLLAVVLVARLAARLIHPRAAWFAAFACLGLSGINLYAADARPYALGIALAAAAAWELVRWLDGARWPDALAFLVLAALIWRVHLIYWPFYMVLALYAGARLARRETPVSRRQAAAVFGLLALALAPVALSAAAVMRQAAAHVIVPPPGWGEFLHLVRVNLVLLCAAGAWVVGRTPLPRGRGSESAPSALLSRDREGAVAEAPVAGVLLIAAWWLVPPVSLFAFSRLTGDSVFVARYLSLALPGAALAATLAASRWLLAAAWRPAAAVLAVGTLLAMGQWRVPWPAHENSDWRGAAAMANRFGWPVVCPSPFVEARWPAWRPDYHLPGFLYAHLAVYPIDSQRVLLPFENSPEAEAYARAELAGPLAAAGGFVIYGSAPGADYWRAWFAAQPQLRQWRARPAAFGDVRVVAFQKNPD